VRAVSICGIENEAYTIEINDEYARVEIEDESPAQIPFAASRGQ
jgi:hypothetical protein